MGRTSLIGSAIDHLSGVVGGAQAPFDKPIWRLGDLARTLPELPAALALVAETFRSGGPIDGAFRERIMVAVATHNRCFYCRTAHRVMARAAGNDTPLVECLLTGSDGCLSVAERAAVAYARDRVTRRFASRSDELWEALGAHFDDHERRVIDAIARVMDAANRFGNTFDALVTRLAGGRVATDASLGGMALVAALFVPAALGMAPVVGVMDELVPPRESCRLQGATCTCRAKCTS